MTATIIVVSAFVILWLLVVGASARLTRLVVFDSLTDVPREQVTHWANVRKHGDSYTRAQAKYDAHWLAKLITCPWCIGFWITAMVATAGGIAAGGWWQYGALGWWTFAAAVFAAAHAASWLAIATHYPTNDDSDGRD